MIEAVIYQNRCWLKKTGQTILMITRPVPVSKDDLPCTHGFFFSEIPRSKEIIFKIELVGLLGPLKDQITEIITSIAKCMQSFFKKIIFN